MGTVRVRIPRTLQRRVQPTSQLLKWLMLQTMACGMMIWHDVAICWPLAQLARLNNINNINNINKGSCMQAPGLCCNWTWLNLTLGWDVVSQICSDSQKVLNLPQEGSGNLWWGTSWITCASKSGSKWKLLAWSMLRPPFWQSPLRVSRYWRSHSAATELRGTGH